MTEILQVPSDKGMWVFTYVPAGDLIKVRDQEAGIKPFVKEHAVVQGHVVTQNGEIGEQFMPEHGIKYFLDSTKDLSAYKVTVYFGVSKDSITVDTLKVVRDWVRRQDKEATSLPRQEKKVTRAAVLRAVGDTGLTMYGVSERGEAIDRLAQIVMQDGQRSMALDLVSGMLDDGSIVLAEIAQSLRFEKGNV